MTDLPQRQQALLADLAAEAMRANGLEPVFSRDVLRQLESLHGPSDEGRGGTAEIEDLTALAWCSIDNDDSRDLDQLTASESLGNGRVRILVAIADVDALVHKDTPIDQHARTNTTSVYTGARIFPMLPEVLSTGWTSLNPGEDRVAVVTEMTFAADGAMEGSRMRRARVFNHAQLAYDALSEWIDGHAPMPKAAAAVRGLEASLRVQDTLAQQLRRRRHAGGALEFQTFQPRARFDDRGEVIDIEQQVQNRARQLIEEFMIATNGVTARYLAGRKRASLRRVVRVPENWPRIVEVAAEYGERLPREPDSLALEQFLARQRERDPLRFPDLSLVVIKLMGSGEYVVEAPGSEPIGHFGLAVRDYAHSTAPNRRFPDLVTQRLLKAALADAKPAYSNGELNLLAMHCTAQEDAANKVERQMRKSEAALVLRRHVGHTFDGVVTGFSKGSTWVRIFSPPAEGKLFVAGGLPVGQRVRVRLLRTNVERGFIDFEPLE